MEKLIKPVLFYNTDISDEISVDGQVIKKRNHPITSDYLQFDNLRVAFDHNAKKAYACGMFERIDGLYLDVDQVRSRGTFSQDFRILGRRKPVRVQIS